MSNKVKECKCKEVIRKLEMTVTHLGSLQDCILEGKPILPKDHADIKELRQEIAEFIEKYK
jgi:hypothetical protein